jgi:hypothetical protein
MLKRRWRRKIDEATIGLLQPSESLIVGFPAETPEAAPTSWLVDFLRRRYRLYVVALTSERVLVLSRTAAFSSFRLTWSEDRAAVTVTGSDGRLSLRGEQLALDLEFSPQWRAEAQALQTGLAR